MVAPPFPFLPQQVEERLLHERIESAGRLVEDEQPRAVQERLHDADLLPVAEAQIRDLARQVEIEPLREIPHALFVHVPVEAGGVAQQIRRPHIIVIMHFTRQIARLAPDLPRLPYDVLAEYPRRPRRGADQMEQEADRRALARAVRTDESEDFAFPDGKGHLLDAPPLAVPLRQPVQFHDRHMDTSPEKNVLKHIYEYIIFEK